jgi:serine/threonine protein kinase
MRRHELSAASAGPSSRFKAIKVLGQGSFGKAVLVEDRETQKLCVVKQVGAPRSTN